MSERAELADRNYTPQELAQVWGCCTAKIYRMLRSGALKGFKLGRDWRIREVDRREYEQANLYQAPLPRRRGQACKAPAVPIRIV